MTPSKADYVRSQGQTRPHHCHWPGCGRQVPPSLWGCKEHWFTLPKPIRDRIWSTYRPGQEIDGKPSEAYIRMAREAQAWIAEYEAGKPLGESIGEEAADVAAAVARSSLAAKVVPKVGPKGEEGTIYYLGTLGRLFLAWGIAPRSDHSHADESLWVDEPPFEGMIRTMCSQCGGFVGYRPVSLGTPGGRRSNRGKTPAKAARSTRRSSGRGPRGPPG